jgi:hypothetical protein
MMRDEMDPDSLRVQGEVLRRLSGPEKFAAACEMTTFAMRLTRAGIKARWPEATEEQLNEEHYRLVFGSEVAREVLEYRRQRRAARSSGE